MQAEGGGALRVVVHLHLADEAGPPEQLQSKQS